MTISEVSKKYDISVDTLRYYERVGLIPSVPRSSSGKRDYDEVSCAWVEQMKCFRSAGVQIEALMEYVELYRQGDSTREARKAILEGQRDKLLAHIAEMQRSLDLLDHKIGVLEGVIPCQGILEDGCLPIDKN